MSIDYLNILGIQRYQLRASSTAEPDVQEHVLQLKKSVEACTACPLHQSRTHTVFGVGSLTPELMIIGEAPGFYEDQQGEPFVGRAGSLLNNMLKACGLTRESVYIANMIKCRPPNNRDPAPLELSQCRHFLDTQIKLLNPKLILLVGRIAAQNLLQRPDTLSKLRGTLHQYLQIPVIVSYHPAYLLRNPKDKKKTFLDLQTLCNVLKKNPP